VSLKRWLNKGDLQKVEITPQSLRDLQRLIDRDIKDAQVASLSTDRRFAVAYNAALGLGLANYAIRRHGYRVAAKVGHHRVTFLVAGSVLGEDAREHLSFFDLCRRKRNKLDYEVSGVATELEVAELVERVIELRKRLDES